ncbi:MAG: nitrite/sulfite reductase [Saprospiraceae bacterium]|nr:nitrite/sulfite reductase [Saprospiraceae bacterium]
MKTASSNGFQISPADQKDIHELEENIKLFQNGQMPDERFRHYRLTRGVYGQRQFGVQMFRTKLPYGKVTSRQLEVIADLAEKYGHNNLHITTRQNIQLHFVKLANAPLVWKGLAQAGLTARGACGNTVRNITASPTAGIDPREPFDVTPYVHATFEYFLRNSICQDMGRKIKMAFSSSTEDSGFTYFHDFGFIAIQKEINGELVNGFKVVVGGGLGAQSIVAPTIAEFIPASDILPFIDAGIRVFDRYGERQKRHKARMKFLVKDLGVDGFLEKLEEEQKAIPFQRISVSAPPEIEIPQGPWPQLAYDREAFELWKSSNVFQQKQEGYLGVYLKIHLGDVSPDTARALAELVRETAADDIRFTAEQNILLRYVKPEALPYLYSQLHKLGLADPGHRSIADITACPGTDTCALGVTNSTGLASALKNIVQKEYPHLLNIDDIHIKISGCMNSCGQHMAAPIGFHGSSIKKGIKVIPAMQVVVGGGIDPATGEGYVADKVIKLPSRRIPDAVRMLLSDFEDNQLDGEIYLKYAQRQGKIYFYNLLKPLADTDDVHDKEFFDWGQDQEYIQSIGVGECAGVSYDMVGAILGDAIEKINESKVAAAEEAWSEAIYHAYTGMVIAAKAWLLAKDIKCNTHIGIIEDFETNFSSDPEFSLDVPFSELVLQMRDHNPEQEFALQYLKTAHWFVGKIIENRKAEGETADKLVLDSYYKA